MSRSAEIVWLTQEAGSDPMGEFGAESRMANPPATPRSPIVTERPAAPPARQAAAVLPVRVPQGRRFVWLAALALLALVQAPFVVLWALQAVNGPAPMAIEVVKPAVAFAAAPAVPVERTLIAPPPRPAAPAVRPAPPGSLSGFLRVDVAVPMRIIEDGRLLGTTDVDRLML